MTQRALLIIDMQMGLFHGSEKPHHAPQTLSNINLLIDKSHRAAVPVFAARHTGPAGSPIEAGSALTQLIPELNIDPALDVIFDKTRPNCFFKTELASLLHEAKIDRLVIAGMKTEFCIDTTCRAAADLGLQPILIADAHTTMNSRVLSAESIIAHHNQTLNGAFVQLITTDECLF